MPSPRRPHLPDDADAQASDAQERIERLERRTARAKSPTKDPDPLNPWGLSWVNSVRVSSTVDGDGWQALSYGHPAYFGEFAGPDWSLAATEPDFGSKAWVYVVQLDWSPAAPLDGWIQVRGISSSDRYYRPLSGGTTLAVVVLQSTPALNYFGLKVRHLLDPDGEVSGTPLEDAFCAGSLLVQEAGPWLFAA